MCGKGSARSTTGKLIAPPQVQRMFTAQVRSDDGGGYGYGWFTTHTARGDSLIYHGGDNPGYHTECRWYRERDLTIIVFTNLELYDESGSGLGLHKRIIASALERIDRGETVPLPSTADGRGRERPLSFRVHEDAPDGRGGGRERISAAALVRGQSGSDHRLLGLNDQRLADANEKAKALLDAVAARDSAAVKNTLDKGNAAILPRLCVRRARRHGEAVRSVQVHAPVWKQALAGGDDFTGADVHALDVRAQDDRLPVHVEERQLLRDDFRYRRAPRAHACPWCSWSAISSWCGTSSAVAAPSFATAATGCCQTARRHYAHRPVTQAH
jgi:hypothetical protein